jgi:exonuclease SbcC
MEKFTLSLAIRVALINISNLPRPNFLVIDEGFGVLDAENLATMQTLFSFLKSNFEFIMIVSHLEALRDMVDKQIEITKDNGFSKVNFV